MTGGGRQPIATNFVTQYWGKAPEGAQGEVSWHPLAYHSLDVAAVGQALFAARPALPPFLGRIENPFAPFPARVGMNRPRRPIRAHRLFMKHLQPIRSVERRKFGLTSRANSACQNAIFGSYRALSGPVDVLVAFSAALFQCFVD